MKKEAHAKKRKRRLVDYDVLQRQIRSDILNLAAPAITPDDATRMAQAAVDTLRKKEDLTDVLAAGAYIAARDAEALRLLAE